MERYFMPRKPCNNEKAIAGGETYSVINDFLAS
jgi:hypothetical protein